MNTSEQFFYDHAGYGYDPQTQTAEEGRRECAAALALAEEQGREAGLSFEWMIDPDIDSSDFDEDPDPWQLWACICHNSEGETVASLWGIDFGRDGEPWGNAYRRVVEAELASEALPVEAE